MKKIIQIISLFILALSCRITKAQLPLQIGDAIITGRINPLANPPVNSVLYVLRAGNTAGVPMNNDVWTTTYPTSNPKPNYTTWSFDDLGSVFGITIDDANRIYVANTKMFSDINPIKKSSIYMIDGNSTSGAVTVVASALSGSPAYMSQLTGEYGNLKFVRMNGTGYIYVSDFGGKKIHCLKQLSGGMLQYLFSFDPQFGNNTDGQIPYGLAIRKLASGFKLYFARMGKGSAWTEAENSYYGSNNNEIWAVNIDPSTGNFLGTEVKQNLPSTILQNPFADIDFNYNYKTMLCGQQSITNGSQGTVWPNGTIGAHQSRIYEFEESSPDNWVFSSGSTASGIKFESGNTAMTSYAAGKNAVGGVSYGHNILGKNNEFKCDTSVWFTTDIIYHSGITGGAAPTSPAPKAPLPASHVVYGVQAMHSSGGTQNTALNFDLDNIYAYPAGVSSKGKVGDIEMLNPPECPEVFSPCNCGEWGSNDYTVNGKSNKFTCNNGPVTIAANQGDVFTLTPNYFCTNATGQPCDATIKYDIFYPDGTTLLNQTSLQAFKLDKCGINSIVMTPTCGGTTCPPCEFSINVNCCNCTPSFKPILFTQTGDPNNPKTLNLTCGGTYTDVLECFKNHFIYIDNPCGENCSPDSVVTTVKYPDGTTTVGYYLLTSIFIPNQVGTYQVTIKIKCNGKWCPNDCKFTFKQTKKCEPPCDNCKINGQDKVKAGFNSSNPPTSYTVGTFPASTTLNAGLFLGGGTDTYTQIRANIVDIQLTSENSACLQCYNTPNQWGSITAGNLNGLNGVPTAGSAHQTNANNNPREIVFNPTAPVTIPMMTPLTLNLQLPGVNPLSCCCIHVTVFVKITFRNNKCEECSKIVRIELKECPGQEGQAPTLTFIEGGWPVYRQHAPSNEDAKQMSDIKANIKKD